MPADGPKLGNIQPESSGGFLPALYFCSLFHVRQYLWSVWKHGATREVLSEHSWPRGFFRNRVIRHDVLCHRKPNYKTLINFRFRMSGNFLLGYRNVGLVPDGVSSSLSTEKCDEALASALPHTAFSSSSVFSSGYTPGYAKLNRRGGTHTSHTSQDAGRSRSPSWHMCIHPYE